MAMNGVMLIVNLFLQVFFTHYSFKAFDRFVRNTHESTQLKVDIIGMDTNAYVCDVCVLLLL